MGVLAEFFVSTKEQALQYDSEAKLPTDDVCQSGNINSLHISTLLAILQKEEWGEDIMDLFVTVVERDGGEEIVEQLPDEFIRLFAPLGSADLRAAVVEWAKTEEVSVEPAEIEPFVIELQTLAKNALATNRPMFLWNCL